MVHPVLILYNLCIHPSIHVGVPNRAKNHEAVAFLPISFPLSGAAHAHLMIKAKGGCAAAPTLSSSNSIVRFFRLVTRPSAVRPFTPFPNASTDGERVGKTKQSAAPPQCKKSSVIGWGEIRIDSSTSGIETVYYF